MRVMIARKMHTLFNIEDRIDSKWEDQKKSDGKILLILAKHFFDFLFSYLIILILSF